MLEQKTQRPEKMHGFPDPDPDGISLARNRQPGLAVLFDRDGQPAVANRKTVPLPEGAKPRQKAVVHARKTHCDHRSTLRSFPSIRLTNRFSGFIM